MDRIEDIIGHGKLTEVFGYWPSFHDSEVQWLKLSRNSEDGCRGPSLDALVHTFEMTNQVGEDGYVLRNHVLIHLRFCGLAELKIEDFNHQNVLMELALTDIGDRQLENLRWSVKFDSTFGADASFQCQKIEVTSVVPCDKSGTPL